jgi:hypothetical protein
MLQICLFYLVLFLTFLTGIDIQILSARLEALRGIAIPWDAPGEEPEVGEAFQSAGLALLGHTSPRRSFA